MSTVRELTRVSTDNDMCEHRPRELWKQLKQQMEGRFAALLPAGYAIADAKLFDDDGASAVTLLLAIFQPQPEDGRWRESPTVHLVILRHRDSWTKVAEFGPFEAAGCAMENYVVIDLVDLDRDGQPEIEVSGPPGNVGRKLALFSLDKDHLEILQSPEPGGIFWGTIAMGPQDIDGDGVMEVVDGDYEGYSQGPHRTERVWKLQGHAFVRWQLRHFTEDKLDSVQPWLPDAK